MKKIAVLLILAGSITSLNASAVDTSGCSQMVEKNLLLATALGGSLAAKALQAPSAQCWNSRDGQIQMTYRWAEQNVSSDQAQVSFWTSVQGVERTVLAATQCQLSSSTQGVQSRTCVATAILKLDTAQGVSVEVAPVRDGRWDTRGFQQNYQFNF